MKKVFGRAHLVIAASIVVLLATTSTAFADTAEGGADSAGPSPTSYLGVYFVPSCNPGLVYDDYFGQIGYAYNGGAAYEAPGSSYNNLTDINDAASNHSLGHGVGPGAYFFMGGPSYAPSGTSYYNWGVDQAYDAYVSFNNAQSATGNKYTFNFLFGDIEGNPGQYGWTSSIANNQQVWDGFYQSLQSIGVNVGVYSAPDAWNTLMGGQSVTTVEWTYEQNADPGSPYPCPTATFSGGPGTGSAATFFDYTSVYNNLVWQWSIGSGYGDFDQINLTRWNYLFGTSYNP